MSVGQCSVGRLFTANKTSPYEGLEFERRQSGVVRVADGVRVSLRGAGI